MYDHPIGPTNPHNSPDGRARALLLRYLTPEQRRMYWWGGTIDTSKGPGLFSPRSVVVTAQSGTRYLVNWQQCYKLGLFGCERHYCAYPLGVPDDDILLAKILALKYREKHFLSVAK
jgi:hypothetical protein